MAAAARTPKVLRIAIIQDGNIVQQRLIRQGQTVTVGDSPKSTFVVPGLPRKEYPIFVAGRSGYVLNFTERMRGKISSGGAVVGLDRLRNDPSVNREADSWRLPLTEQDRGKIVIDHLTVLFQFVQPPPAAATKPIRAMDFRPRLLDEDDPVFLGFLAIFTALAALLLIWVWNTPAPQIRSIDEIPDRFTRLIFDAPAEPEVDLATEAESKVEKQKEPEPQKAKEDGGDKPKSKVEQARERESIKQDLAERSMLIKVFTTRGENARGDYAEDLWSEQDKGIEDLDAAAESVGKVKVAGADGDDGLRAGNGGGTEDVDIELGSAGGGGTDLAGGPEVKVEGTVELGEPADLTDGSNASQIKQVVEENKARVTYCYEEELKSDPGLGGRVEVEWVVRMGRVTSANVFTNTTGSSELGDCIVKQVLRWRFPPELEEEVMYPFIFKKKQ